MNGRKSSSTEYMYEYTVFDSRDFAVSNCDLWFHFAACACNYKIPLFHLHNHHSSCTSVTPTHLLRSHSFSHHTAGEEAIKKGNEAVRTLQFTLQTKVSDGKEMISITLGMPLIWLRFALLKLIELKYTRMKRKRWKPCYMREENWLCTQNTHMHSLIDTSVTVRPNTRYYAPRLIVRVSGEDISRLNALRPGSDKDFQAYHK